MLAALRRLPALDRATASGRGLAVGPDASARRSATSAAAPSAWSATATSRNRSRPSSTAHGRSGRCTPAPATTATPRLAATARPARRQRHRLAAPAADRARPRHLLDRAALARMKADAVLVNTSRGADRRRGRACRRAGAAAELAAAGLRRVRRRTGRRRQSAAEPGQRGAHARTSPGTPSTPCGATWSVAVDNCRRLRDGREFANVVNQVS